MTNRLAVVLACDSQTDRGTFFTFSALEVSDFILHKYEPIIRQFGVIGVLSFPYKFTCPRGNVEGAWQDKTVHR